MAENSIADQIVSAIESELKTLASLKTVTRKPPAQGDFEKFSSGQLPIAVIMGGLPAVTSAAARKVKFKSILPISINVFIRDNVSPGTSIYDVADDIWAMLMNLPRDDKGAYLNGLVLDYEVIPEQVFDIDPPYVSFRYDIEVSYIHSNRSI